MEPQKSAVHESNEEDIVQFPFQNSLHRRLIAILLQNPFWNDFHVLHSLQKQNPEMSMEELRRLRRECKLETREDVCDLLLRKAFSSCGSGLNTRQLDFVMKVYPELRDQDVRTNEPGKLIVYNCFGGQKARMHGRVYIHVFVDLFNGYAFGKLSHQRTVNAGLSVLGTHVAPLYLDYNHKLQTIIHSTQISYDINEIEELKADGTIAGLGIKWQLSRRVFGHVERFQKALMISDFYSRPNVTSTNFHELQYSFGQWLKKYNVGVQLY